MDRRLFEAAWTGNVEYLLQLMKDDPCMLSAVALAGAETPLHIACMAGHLSFAKEVMKLRQEFAGELNQDGFSPLHIASANGYLEIVKELLKVDHNLCLPKGRERRTPLHYAAIKGRVDVIRELLSASVDSIAEVTARGETALHLAVKNNQFEAFNFLAEHLKQFNKDDVFNNKDEQGNTILHVAVSRKQYEVVHVMLKKHATRSVVQVNSLNDMGLTPLDFLQFFQSEAGDREMEEMLRGAGAMRGKASYSPEPVADTQNQVVATNSPSNDQSRTQSPYRQLLEYFKYNQINDSPSQVRGTLLVIAVLIATATYQGVLSPPGGVWQDDCGSNNNVTAKAIHTAGKAVMGLHNSMSYGSFPFLNSIGFFTSLHMINVLTIGFPLRLELQVSILSLVATYDTCMNAIAPNSTITFFFSVISTVIPIILQITTMVVRNYPKRPLAALWCGNQSNA